MSDVLAALIATAPVAVLAIIFCPAKRDFDD